MIRQKAVQMEVQKEVQMEVQKEVEVEVQKEDCARMAACARSCSARACPSTPPSGSWRSEHPVRCASRLQIVFC